MTNLAIINGTVYWEGRLQKGDVLIQDGKVRSFGDRIGVPAGVEVFDAEGYGVFPGFADVHVHLREPGFSYKETIQTGTQAAARGGFTLVCAMPNLSPAVDSKQTLAAEQALIDRDALIRVLPYAAITMGQRGEELVDMEGLAGSCVAFSDDGRGVQDAEMMRAAMKAAAGLGKVIAAHCEDESLIPKGACIHDGSYARAHGLVGIPCASEYEQAVRDIGLAEQTGCRYHVCHVSCRETVGAIRDAKQKGLPVSGEVTPHHLAFCDDDLQDDGRFKMNPPLRSAEDRAALIEGVRDGTLEVIATDHAPHSAEEKAGGLLKSAMGVVGLELCFAAVNTHLCRPGHIDLAQLVEMMSIRPRELMGLPWGIRIGEPADLVVVDPERAFVVDPQTFASKGRSTPFEGRTLWGDILLTICDGRTVYRKSSD
ncbi:MAG: dihydroorotase [Anaerovoracaceae bacterium]